MATPYQLLVAEIDRIVGSPYPTQLKSLHDIVIFKCTGDDVSRWARSRPCQISRLATCICDALAQWPYVLSVVTYVAQNVLMRDAILQVQPSLLNDLVSHAMRHTDLESRYAAAVTAILSHPLPQDIALPSEVQGFFVRLLDNAAREPSAKTLKPAYSILNGTSNALVDLASDHTLSRLEDHFFSILKNSKNADDQNLSLYCLAMMSELVTASERPRSSSVSFFDTQDFLASTPSAQAKWNSDGMNQFFVGNKAGKTLHLVALRVLWACRSSIEDGIEEVLDSLHLANKVVLAVSRSARLAWAQANPIILRKLQDKALSEDIDRRVSTATVAFIGKMCDVDSIAPSIFDRVRNLMLQPWHLSATSLSLGLETLLEDFALVLDEDIVRQMMFKMIDFLTQGGMQEVVEASMACSSVLRALRRMLDHHPAVSKGCAAFLQAATVSEKLTLLTSRLTTPMDITRLADLCPNAAMRSLQHDARNLSALCISAGMYNTDRQVSMIVSEQLITLHGRSAAMVNHCSHTGRRALLTKELTINQERDLHDVLIGGWRQALEARIAQRARAEHDDMREFFTSACAELEERCENVEAPLSRERERSHDLEKQLHDLQTLHRELEHRCIDCDLRCSALEAEKDDLIAEIESAHDENHNLLLRNDKLSQEVHKIQQELTAQLNENQREREAIELERDAILARRQAETEDLEEQLSNVREELHQALQVSKAKQLDLDKTDAEVERVRAELATLKLEINEQKTQIQDARESYEVLSKVNKRLEAELNAATKHAEAVSKEHRDDTYSLRQKAEEEAQAVRILHATELAEVRKQHQADTEHFENRLSRLQADLNQGQEQFNREIAARDSKIAGHQKRIDQLTSKCTKKDEQIIQANAMRNNLMAALNVGMPVVQSSLPVRSRSSPEELSPYASEPSPLTPTPESGEQALHLALHQSSRKSNAGPTPKRPKPRRSVSLRAPPSASVRMSASRPRVGRGFSRASSAVGDAASRQPLAIISSNSSPTKSAMRKPNQSGRRSVVEPRFEQSSFGGDSIFAGTQASKAVDDADMADDLSETEI